MASQAKRRHHQRQKHKKAFPLVNLKATAKPSIQETEEDTTISKMETVQQESNCEFRHLSYRRVTPVCHTQLCAHIILRKKSLFIVLSPQMLNELSSNDILGASHVLSLRSQIVMLKVLLADYQADLKSHFVISNYLMPHFAISKSPIRCVSTET